MSYSVFFDNKDGTKNLTVSLLIKVLMDMKKVNGASKIRIEFKDDPKVRKIIYILEEDGVVSIGIE